MQLQHGGHSQQEPLPSHCVSSISQGAQGGSVASQPVPDPHQVWMNDHRNSVLCTAKFVSLSVSPGCNSNEINWTSSERSLLKIICVWDLSAFTLYPKHAPASTCSPCTEQPYATSFLSIRELLSLGAHSLLTDKHVQMCLFVCLSECFPPHFAYIAYA